MNLLIPDYVVPVGISVLLALSFPLTAHFRHNSQRKQYYFLQGITLLGAIFGAKISVLFGDYHWPWVTLKDWRQVIWSGRSITGALIFGFVCRNRQTDDRLCHASKRLFCRLPFLSPWDLEMGLTASCAAGSHTKGGRSPWSGRCLALSNPSDRNHISIYSGAALYPIA